MITRIQLLWFILLMIGSSLPLAAQCLQDIELILKQQKGKSSLDSYLEKVNYYSYHCRELGFGYTQHVYRIVCDQDTGETTGLNIVAAGNYIVSASRLHFRHFNARTTYLIDTVMAQQFISSHNALYNTGFDILDFEKNFTDLTYFAIRCKPEPFHGLTPEACRLLEETSEDKIREMLWHFNPETRFYGFLSMFWHGYEFSLTEKALVDSLLKQNSVFYHCQGCRVDVLGFNHVLEDILRETDNTWNGQYQFECPISRCQDLFCSIRD